jgi:hypothetical protein
LEGVECNDRFLECCADVDIASISKGEEERFTKPVSDHLGRKITPPDFRKGRQTALARELLKPKYHAYGFRTVDPTFPKSCTNSVCNQQIKNSRRCQKTERKVILYGYGYGLEMSLAFNLL